MPSDVAGGRRRQVRAGLDLDGTLLRRPDGRPGDGTEADIRGQVLDEAVLARVRELEAVGIRWELISGRTQSVMDSTLRQLTPIWPDAVHRLHLQPEWRGHRVLQGYKSAVLDHLGVSLFVGDTELDKSAAIMASAAWMHVDDFRAGAPLDNMVCLDCGCTPMRACVTDEGPCSWAYPLQCSACAQEVFA